MSLGDDEVAVPSGMGRTYSKPTVPVKARRRESMELDWATEEPTQPRSQARQKIRPRLISVTEEVVVANNHDPRREDD